MQGYWRWRPLVLGLSQHTPPGTLLKSVVDLSITNLLEVSPTCLLVLFAFIIPKPIEATSYKTKNGRQQEASWTSAYHTTSPYRLTSISCHHSQLETWYVPSNPIHILLEDLRSVLPRPILPDPSRLTNDGSYTRVWLEIWPLINNSWALMPKSDNSTWSPGFSKGTRSHRTEETDASIHACPEVSHLPMRSNAFLL
jgi:hypothetical protein